MKAFEFTSDCCDQSLTVVSQLHNSGNLGKVRSRFVNVQSEPIGELARKLPSVRQVLTLVIFHVVAEAGS